MGVQTNEHKNIWNTHIELFRDKLSDYKIKSYNDNYSAVIMETREHPHLETVIKNTMYYLNESDSNNKWKLEIFHGNLNKEFCEKIVEGIDNVELHHIDYDSMGLYDYDSVFRTTEFWKTITSDTILIFQADTVLLKHGIDEFLKYSYVGAPWLKPKEGKYVGNGGLALRNKQKMIEVIENYPNDNYFKEDIYFIKYLNDEDIAPIEVAQRFAVEDLYYNDPFGLHQPKIQYKYLKILMKQGINNINY
jgi:hypothetical protein